MNPFADYRVSSQYGQRTDPITGIKGEMHRGIDLVKVHQSPVYAFVGGLVLHAALGKTGTGFGNYGNVVAIKDKYGALHCYCHLDMCVVKVGQQVDRGQMIGRQGNTGRSTGSHLHYEVRQQCEPSFGWHTDTDPAGYLQDYFAKEKPVVKTEPLPAIQKRVGILFNGANVGTGYLINNQAYVLATLARQRGYEVSYDGKNVIIKDGETR